MNKTHKNLKEIELNEEDALQHLEKIKGRKVKYACHTLDKNVQDFILDANTDFRIVETKKPKKITYFLLTKNNL